MRKVDRGDHFLQRAPGDSFAQVFDIAYALIHRVRHSINMHPANAVMLLILKQ